MLYIIHYDNEKELSKEVRAKLASSFDPECVKYEDLTESYMNFASANRELEKRLSTIDLLVVHPEINCYRLVMDYPEKFSKLRVAFLMPSKEEYEERGRLRLYSYANVDKLIDWIKNLE